MDRKACKRNGSPKGRGSRGLRRRTVLALSCLVALGTAYALILPARTMTEETFCGMEAHTHGEDCWERRLACTLETTVHVHTDSCWAVQQVRTCTSTENHVHDESCFTQPLICEQEDHEHTQLCYGEPEQSCTLEENHVHTQECYAEEKTLACGMEETPEEQPHEHTEQCYETVLICEKQEHSHSPDCYADPEADLETPEVWRQTLPAALTDDWSANILAVARSQLGYAASSRNYITEADGIRPYTRFGQWSGEPYGAWNARFVLFCLRYANIPSAAVPGTPDCASWPGLLGDAYFPVGTDTPSPGDLLFLDSDGDGSADRVGILTETGGNGLAAIEGDCGGLVAQTRYAFGEAALLGFGRIPQNPEQGKYTCGMLSHTHEASCYDGSGGLQCGFGEHTHGESCQAEIREFDYEDDALSMHITVEGPDAEALHLEVAVPDADRLAEFQTALFRDDAPEKEDSGTAKDQQQDLLLLRCLSLLENETAIDLEPYRITAKITVKSGFLAPLAWETARLRAQAEPETELGVVLSALGEEETALYLPEQDQVPSLTATVREGIVAVQAGAFPNPTYTVQYYANIPRFADSGARSMTVFDTSGGHLPTNGGTNKTRQLYLNPTGTVTGKNGGSATENYRVATTMELTRMYSDNTFTYVNAPNTAYVDKLIDSESYRLKEVWVLKEGKAADSTREEDWDIYTTPSQVHFTSRPERAGDGIILITDETCLRLVYDCQDASFTTPSTFYDYDISSGQNADGSWRTGIAGINSESNYATSRNGQRTWRSYQDVLAFGNSNCGTGMGQYGYDGIYLNQYSGRNSGCAFGLAASLSGGQIVYNPYVVAPPLFNEGDAIGKHTYSGSSLTFRRMGDSYTLDSASVSGVGSIRDLQDFFNPSPTAAVTHENILTNDFWPLDGAVNKTDPNFGAAGTSVYYQGYTNAPGTWQDTRNKLPVSDDGRNHNSFFGMQYAVSFTLTEDYIGPLEYCFFGDDDMWVFLDDTLVCDIGGVHSAVGEYVNLWDYLTPGQAGAHTLTFFYTERGSSGSTCYMNFTLPSVTGVNIEQKTTQLKVLKTVEGRGDDREEFRFHIRFLNAQSGSIPDDYAYSRYGADGTVLERDLVICDGSEFSLRAGEYLLIRHLPYGLRYEITELTTEGYSVTNTVDGVLYPGSEAQGTVAQNGQNTVEFTNRRNTFGFSLQKQDTEGSPLAGAVFTLTDSGGSPVAALPEADGSFTVPDSEEASGTVTRFPVNDSGIFRMGGLLPGTYILEEAEAPGGCTALPEGVTLTVGTDGELTVSENTLVSAADGVITVKNEYAPRELTLEKKVRGSDTDRKFEFTVDYTLEDGTPVSRTLSLADGESQRLSVPYNALVTVREGEHNGFSLVFQNGETILESAPDGSCSFRMREDVIITAVNTAGPVLPGSGGAGRMAYDVFGTLLIVLSACFLYGRVRRRGNARKS